MVSLHLVRNELHLLPTTLLTGRLIIQEEIHIKKPWTPNHHNRKQSYRPDHRKQRRKFANKPEQNRWCQEPYREFQEGLLGGRLPRGQVVEGGQASVEHEEADVDVDDEGDHDVVVVDVGFVDCAHTVGGQETVGNARHKVLHASALVT